MKKINAIILAAGMGTRLNPITICKPKPLIKIAGLPIIERQIICLQKYGIHEINIVVGYCRELFTYLVKKYGVKLIINQEYNLFNNIYSMYLAKEYLGNTYVLEGDVFINTPPFQTNINHSTYFTGARQNFHDEWVLNFESDKLKSIWRSDEIKKNSLCKNDKAYVMTGISFWNLNDANIIRFRLNSIMLKLLKCNELKYGQWYWDNVVLECLEELDIRIHKIASNDWFEIDTYSDLQELEILMKDNYV